MTKNSQNELARAYAMLSALRKNIEQVPKQLVEESFVKEFHSALDKLTSTIDVSDFRIPDSEIAPIKLNPVTRFSGGGESRAIYSKVKYVNKQYFLMKIDAILGYFEIITSPEPKRIGFRTSQE